MSNANYKLILIISMIFFFKYIINYQKNINVSSNNYLKDSRNKSYRLGDMIRGYFDNYPEVLQFYRISYPNSIATIYKTKLKSYRKLITNINLNNKNIDYHLLLNIIDTKLINESITIPSKHSLVIHLRTGDIIDKSNHDVNTLLSGRIFNNSNNYYDKNYHKYVKSLNYYKSLSKQYIYFTNIIIVSGFNTESNNCKSLNYIQEIKKYFESLGKLVTLRINHNPDEDFIFMCNSKFFIPSGGGFSSIISDIVRLKSGKVIV